MLTAVRVEHLRLGADMHTARCTRAHVIHRFVRHRFGGCLVLDGHHRDEVSEDKQLLDLFNDALILPVGDEESSILRLAGRGYGKINT